MSYWCIAFFVLLLLTLMIVYFIKVAVMAEYAVLKKFDTIGILIVNMNGMVFTSFNAPANTLISSDQSAVMTLTSMSTGSSTTQKGTTLLNFTVNGYVIATPASMSILSTINNPVTPLKTKTSYGVSTPITGYSFTKLAIGTSKPLNIDSSKFPTADSSLTAYTLTTKDYASVI